MKKLYFYLTMTLFFCVTQVVNAQYGNPYQQRQQRSYTPPPSVNIESSTELMNPHDQVNIILPKCVEAFKLDAFEKEITKGLLLKKFESQNVIFADKDGNLEDKKKKLLEIDKVFYKNLTSILSTEEIEEFKTMDFSETKEEKKKKKRDKRKKRKT